MEIIHKIAAVVIEDNKIFMVKKFGTNIWTSLGGKPEKGETEQEALLREINEEIGCDAKIIRKIGDFEAPAAHDPGFTVRLSSYVVELVGEILLQDPELEECGFIGKDYKAQGVKLPPTIEDQIIPYLQENGLIDWQ